MFIEWRFDMDIMWLIVVLLIWVFVRCRLINWLSLVKDVIFVFVMCVFIKLSFCKFWMLVRILSFWLLICVFFKNSCDSCWYLINFWIDLLLVCVVVRLRSFKFDSVERIFKLLFLMLFKFKINWWIFFGCERWLVRLIGLIFKNFVYLLFKVFVLML